MPKTRWLKLAAWYVAAGYCLEQVTLRAIWGALGRSSGANDFLAVLLFVVCGIVAINAWHCAVEDR